MYKKNEHESCFVIMWILAERFHLNKHWKRLSLLFLQITVIILISSIFVAAGLTGYFQAAGGCIWNIQWQVKKLLMKPVSTTE